MYKNQLQELAQRCGYNIPSYSCVREGPDHAPRFKATVTLNGETYESPGFFSTLRQAEHAAAEVALTSLSKKGPSKDVASKFLDETGVCKNLLQETAQRAGVNLPVYNTERQGPGHIPIFVCTVDVAGFPFIGEPAKSKKMAEKNAAMVAWKSLKKYASNFSPLQDEAGSDRILEQEQNSVARALVAHSNLNQARAQSKSDSFLPLGSARAAPSNYSNHSFTHSISPARSFSQPWPEPPLLPSHAHYPDPAFNDPNYMQPYHSSRPRFSSLLIKPGMAYQPVAESPHGSYHGRQQHQPELRPSPPILRPAQNSRHLQDDGLWQRGGGQHIPLPRPAELPWHEPQYRAPAWPNSQRSMYPGDSSTMIPAPRVRSLVPVYASPPVRGGQSSGRQSEEEGEEDMARKLMSQLKL